MKKIFLLLALCTVANIAIAQDDGTKKNSEQTTEQTTSDNKESEKKESETAKDTTTTAKSREEIEMSGQGGYNPAYGMGYAGQSRK